jgi:hypothetical protein
MVTAAATAAYSSLQHLEENILNALLYGLVVVIWGNVDCDLFTTGPVAAPVSIFWRFAVASVTMLAILLSPVVCGRWRARSSLLPAAGLLRLLL